MSAFKRILVATDLTPASEPAFEQAIRLAADSGAELVLVHAYEIPYLGEPMVITTQAFEEIDTKLRRDLESRLDALADRAKARRIPVRTLMLFGSPYDVIPKAAADERAELLVTGTHGRRTISRFILGSVASSLIATAPCPVLTVRAV